MRTHAACMHVLHTAADPFLKRRMERGDTASAIATVPLDDLLAALRPVA